MGFYGMFGVWEAVLQNDPQSETAGSETRTEKILFGLSEAFHAQGTKEIIRFLRRTVGQLADYRSPKPGVGGSNPPRPAIDKDFANGECKKR